MEIDIALRIAIAVISAYIIASVAFGIKRRIDSTRRQIRGSIENVRRGARDGLIILVLSVLIYLLLDYLWPLPD